MQKPILIKLNYGNTVDIQQWVNANTEHTSMLYNAIAFASEDEYVLFKMQHTGKVAWTTIADTNEHAGVIHDGYHVAGRSNAIVSVRAGAMTATSQAGAATTAAISAGTAAIQSSLAARISTEETVRACTDSALGMRSSHPWFHTDASGKRHHIT